VKKSVRGAKSDELFGFKVILDRQITGEFGQMRFTDGVAEFTMKAGETRTARNLPDGVNFKVTETMFNAKRYVPLVYDLYGDIDAQNPAVVEFVNIEQNGLMVTKTIEGSAADMKKRFAFRVELSDKTINGVITSTANTDYFNFCYSRKIIPRIYRTFIRGIATVLSVAVISVSIHHFFFPPKPLKIL